MLLGEILTVAQLFGKLKRGAPIAIGAGAGGELRNKEGHFSGRCSFALISLGLASARGARIVRSRAERRGDRAFLKWRKPHSAGAERGCHKLAVTYSPGIESKYHRRWAA